MVAGEVDWAVQRERAARAAAREADFMVSMGDERKEGQRGWWETEVETCCISAYYLPIILVFELCGRHCRHWGVVLCSGDIAVQGACHY